MKTKLILVEGIPGSGKSTIARKIADFYTNRGQKVNLYLEGGFHPADLAWNACIPAESLESVLAPYKQIRDEIDKHTQIENGYAIIAYTQIKSDDGAFYRDMESREIYDNRVPFDVFDELIGGRWRNFGKRARERDGLTVFECALLQNQISELLLFRLASIEAIKSHINSLVQAVVELSPILIYLAQTDVRATIEHVAKERVFADGNWIDGIIHYVENSPYGRLHNIKSFDGAIRILEKRKQIELEIVKSLPIHTVILDNSDYDWARLWEEIVSVLVQYENKPARLSGLL